MRRLRIAASVQLPLALGLAPVGSEELWLRLSETAQAEVLGLLARLIVRGVVDDEEGPA